jgi:large subunit ribosomal protein L9
MEIILTQDVKNLGYKDEVVSVRPGYGRNFLIPSGMAVIADKSNRKHLAETLKQRAFKEDKLKKDAEKLAEGLKAATIKIGAKAGENGRIFGSVTTIQIADSLKKSGFEVDRRNITIQQDHIKEVGTYQANLNLHREVRIQIDFEVVSE